MPWPTKEQTDDVLSHFALYGDDMVCPKEDERHASWRASVTADRYFRYDRDVGHVQCSLCGAKALRSYKPPAITFERPLTKDYVITINGDPVRDGEFATFDEALHRYRELEAKFQGTRLDVRMHNRDRVDLHCPNGLTEEEQDILDGADLL